MKTHWCPALLACAVLPTAASARPDPAPEPAEPLARSLYEGGSPSYLTAADDSTFKVYFKDGIRFETSDKMFTARFGGRIQHDWAWFSEDIEAQNAAFDFENGSEFRRMRLYISGSVYEYFDYKIQLDFANGLDTNVGGGVNGNERPNFKDVYMGANLNNQVNFRFGQFYEPAGLEEQTSSNYISFLERATSSGIAPARNPGAMFHGRLDNQRFTYAIGVFHDDSDDNGDDANGSGMYSFTGRLTGLPMADENGNLVHVGAWASERDLGGMFDKDFRPPAHLSPSLINNSAFLADESSLYGLELGAIFDSMWVHGEYGMIDVNAQDGGPDAEISGHYIAAGYYLTGEKRGYNKKSATFDKTKVLSPYGQDGGLGAFEVAVRYGSTEFENIRGGAGGTDELEDITLGVNWYLNTNVRVQVNYVDFDLDSDKFALNEDGNAFLVRFHVWI